MTRWVPSHLETGRNEVADEWAKMAVENVGDAMAREYMRETGFAP